MATVLVIGLLGLAISRPWSGQDNAVPANNPGIPAHEVAENGKWVLDPEFLAAVSALQSENFQAAVEALERFRTRAPHVPEIHVNLGFAYLGLELPALAENSFQQALRLQPRQANAYYGMGLVHELRGDLELARGAMRTFIHLADERDPFVRKARTALWEWQESH